MAIKPIPEPQPTTTWLLRPFAPDQAACVAGWALTPREIQWLAPRTRPPLDAEKVIAWSGPGRQAFVMQQGAEPPVAYGELNTLRRFREYWLGHLVVDPARRGRGLGTELTRLLLERAFRRLGARRVTLVVFPENRAALRAYEKAGMTFDGYETHYFAPYRREVRLARLEARRR